MLRIDLRMAEGQAPSSVRPALTGVVLLLGFVALLVAVLNRPARGEGDYKFGMALMEQLGWDDLAQKHFSDLKKAPSRSSQLTGALGLGGIKWRLAGRAAKKNKTEEAKKLYDEAKKLIEDFIKEAPSEHPDRADALDTLGKIKKQSIKTLLARRKETTDQKEKDDIGRELKDIFDKLIKPLEEAAERAWEVFKKYEEREKTPKEVLAHALDKAVQAMQRYYNMVLEEAPLYEEGSDERKKFIEKLLTSLTREKARYDERDFGGVVIWIEYAIGRAYVLAGKVDKACEDGFDPVCEFNPRGLSAAARQWVNNLRFWAFHDRAKALFDAEKYDKAVEAADDLFHALPWALDDLKGNATLIIKARALFKKDPPDYQGAIRECKRVIEKNLMPWPNNASRLLAEIQKELEEKNEKAVLGPPELHRIAIGNYHSAQEQRNPRARRRYLERAVRGFKKTISACRDDEVQYKVRLEHEPSAWFELGICYSSMRLWYEARFSFEAVLRYFAKDVVGRSLAGHPAFKEALEEIKRKIKSKKIKPKEGEILNEYALLFEEAMKSESLGKLLTGVDARLTKSANNLVVAARRRHRESRSPFDAERLSEAIETLIRVRPKTKDLADFHIGLLRRQVAAGHLKSNRPEAGAKKLEEAAVLFLNAAKTQARIRELAYHMAGKAYYQAMSEVENPELAKRHPKLAARAAEFGKKALEAFGKFEELAIKGRGKGSPKEEEKRKKRMVEVEVARPVIHMSLGDFDEAVKAADRFLKNADRDKKFDSTVTWTRLRALREKTLSAVGTPGEREALTNLIHASEELRGDKNYYTAALSMVGSVYNEAAGKIAAMAEGKPEEEKAALMKRAAEYRLKFAGNMKKLMELKPKSERGIGFYVFIAEEFYRQKVYDAAREIYSDKILAQFDPSGEGKKTDIGPDDFEEAAKKVGIKIFKREVDLRRVRTEIKSLKELVFGEPLGERYDKTYMEKLLRRMDQPDRDKAITIMKNILKQNPKFKEKLIHPPMKRDWRKAVTVIAKILADNPKLQCKAELERIKVELTLRLHLLRVKLNLSDCNIALAKDLQASKPEEAKPLWKEAIKLLKVVRVYYWRDPELRVLQAESNENLGDLQAARELYVEAHQKSQDRSNSWFRSQIALSQIFFRQGEAEKTDKKLAEKHFRNALKFPTLVVFGPKKDREEHWPDAASFVAKCEAAIEGLDVKLVLKKYENIKIEVVGGYNRTITPLDQELGLQLTIIDRKIEMKEIKEKDGKKLYKEAFERHFRGLPDRKIEFVDAQLRHKRVKKREAARLRKVALARLLYQSPLGDFVLQKLGVKLGVIQTEKEGIPVRLLSDKAKKAAIKIRLLTKDGKKRPISEIDAKLLRKDFDGSEAVPEGGPPAEGKPPAEGEGPVEKEGAPAEGGAPAPDASPAAAAGEGVTQ